MLGATTNVCAAATHGAASSSAAAKKRDQVFISVPPKGDDGSPAAAGRPTAGAGGERPHCRGAAMVAHYGIPAAAGRSHTGFWKNGRDRLTLGGVALRVER